MRGPEDTVQLSPVMLPVTDRAMVVVFENYTKQCSGNHMVPGVELGACKASGITPIFHLWAMWILVHKRTGKKITWQKVLWRQWGQRIQDKDVWHCSSCKCLEEDYLELRRGWCSPNGVIISKVSVGCLPYRILLNDLHQSAYTPHHISLPTNLLPSNCHPHSAAFMHQF